MPRLWLMGLLVLLSTAYARAADSPDLVDLAAHIPGIIVDARYAGAENFIGEPIDGYEAPKVLLSRPAAEALKRVQAQLKAEGLTLMVFDGYRPQSAVDHFMRWIEDTGDTRNKAAYYPNVAKNRLVPDGYIARQSGHSRGSTVDLTIARLVDGGSTEPLDMGSPWDFFGAISHPSSTVVSSEARANRMLLRVMMMSAGFRPYDAEWWHFTLAAEPYPNSYFNVPVK